MKMSTRGRYAVRILLSIARYQKNGPVSKTVITNEEKISSDYIEQIIVPLKNSGLVIGVRGVKGGFRLAKDPKEISIYDILRVSEGTINLVDCDNMDCRGRKKSQCVVNPVWNGAAKILKDYFSDISLQDLLEKMEDL